jgi:hypothetical protein
MEFGFFDISGKSLGRDKIFDSGKFLISQKCLAFALERLGAIAPDEMKTRRMMPRQPAN